VLHQLLNLEYLEVGWLVIGHTCTIRPPDHADSGGFTHGFTYYPDTRRYGAIRFGQIEWSRLWVHIYSFNADTSSLGAQRTNNKFGTILYLCVILMFAD
jgi:hypothetical protein